MTYQVNEKALTKSVDLYAAINVKVIRGDQVFNSHYYSEASKTSPLRATDKQNQQWINEVLNDAIKRAFSDQNLLDYLRGNS